MRANSAQPICPAHAVSRRVRSCLRTAVRISPLLPLGACGGILDPQGPIGDSDGLIMLNALEIMLAIVMPTLVAALLFAWWFRASNTRARYLPNFDYSGRLELIVWAIPLLVILFLGGVIWIGSHDLDPYKPIASRNAPLNVQVVSLDWKWLFIYPDQHIATVNQLVVPANTPIHFYLTSASVMNVFFVPQLGSMIYAMNGMVSQLWLEANHQGNYYGESSQFSGDGFSGMHFTMRAVAPADFASWVQSVQQGRGPTLDLTGYATLEKQSQNVQPYAYRSVDPSLFRAITARTVPPGPGPQTGPGGLRGHPRPEG
ncbi:MAG TPA: ubiquinol oxidase subunit II [Acetobacteraceae bacterium]|nr:ubiquinol oxidase subunit II [Acetobacteraceae bacterium]